MQDFPGRLRFLRQQRGLSQEALGQAVGKKSTTVSTWERGESEPSLDDIKKIAAVLDVSAARLAYGETVVDAARATVEEAPADYRKSGSSAAPLLLPHHPSSPKMLDPRFQPRAEPSLQMCRDYIEEYLRRANAQPGGIGYAWVKLQKNFPLEEFEPTQTPKKDSS